MKRLNYPRERLVISTKFIRCNDGKGKDCNIKFLIGNPVNREHSLSRKHIIEGVNDSLKRLQMDYVDVVFAHVMDLEVSVEEICRGFH